MQGTVAPGLVPRPPQLEEHIAQGWALQGAGTSLTQATVSLYSILGARMHRGKDVGRLPRLPHALKETSEEREQWV